MAEFVAIGNRSFVLALVGVGAEPLRAETPEEFVEAVRKTALDRDVRVVFVPENLAMQATEALKAFRRRSPAALLPLPLLPSDAHPSLQEIRHLVEQATGASLI